MEAPEAVPEPEPGNIVTNCLKGTVLTVGQGTQIAFGESADVSDEVAAFLRGRGQVE